MNKSCTIVVSSCDSYEDAWCPFFTLFKKQWPLCPFPIVLNTESKEYQFEGLDISIKKLYKSNESIGWSHRLKKVLSEIDSEYVIMLLDDFFLEDLVNEAVINQCIEWMCADPKIAVFYFMPSSQVGSKDGKYDGFALMPQNARYRLNCQAALWRRNFLIKCLRDHENPWQFETWGSVRSRRYSEEFYAISDPKLKVFDYDYGKPIIQGKWNIEEVQRIKEKFNIDINTDGLGIGKNDVIRKRSLLNRVYTTIKSLL